MTNKFNFEKNLVEKNLKIRKSWKKRTRGNYVAEASQYQQYCTGQHSSKTQKKLEFQTIFEKVTLEPLKQIGDWYQSMRLEKSVPKMGLRSVRC